MKKFMSVLGVSLMVVSSLFASGSKETSEGANFAANGWNPNKEITMRCPNAAGGTADTLTRIFSKGLQNELDATSVVKNIVGAGGALAINDLNKKDASLNDLMCGAPVRRCIYRLVKHQLQ